MANQARGEVSLVVGDRTYTLRPTLSAFCALEDLSGKTYVDVMNEASAGSARALRDLLWSYLQSQHAEEFDSVNKAAALVDEVGMEAVGEQLERLGELNRIEDEEKKTKTRPRRARVA